MMGDLAWTRKNKYVGLPREALLRHVTILGNSGSGKSETILRIAYGSRVSYNMQVIFLDMKGETKRAEEESEDNAARFVAAMKLAETRTVSVFPSLFYNGWQGTPVELKNKLLSVIDYGESAYYGDVAANLLDLAVNTPIIPRSSSAFLANLSIDQLKIAYKQDPANYRRVFNLDKEMVKEVEMRYQVFFAAMAGQLDGTMDFANIDAAYLRVRGFALRNEAPRLGRFFVYDLMQYLESRRQSGTHTLLIIDEFNVLRMPDTSILFEQARSFGCSLVVAAQGYAGLGPKDTANRILDASSTYVLHASSDAFEICKRAGKKLFLGTNWSEDENGMLRKQHRLAYDWRIQPHDVIDQGPGQAYWIYRGHSQQVQSARIPITPEQIKDAWITIREQESVQKTLLQVGASSQGSKKSTITSTPLQQPAKPQKIQSSPVPQLPDEDEPDDF